MPVFARMALPILALCGAALLMGSCGVENPTGGITSRVGQARNAQAVSSLQQALITASVVASDGASAQGPALAAELQARDSTNSYTAELPTEPGRIQVIGGGGGPLLLVSYSEGDAGQPGYVAAWQSGATTRWYAGQQPPSYVAAAPSGAGWSASAPTAASPSSATPVSTGPQ
jgi:hypothetical protein